MSRKSLKCTAAALALLLPALVLAQQASSGAAKPAPAGAVYLNGKIFTADDKDSVVQAFAVSGDRFVAVGANDKIRAFIGPNTKVIDLKGHFVSPGLTDDHMHNEGGGPGLDLSHTRSIADLLAVVGKAAAAAEPGALLFSNADWHEAQLKEQRLPTTAELDTVSPRNPVVLLRGGHTYILNSAAFRKYNINKDTASPSGGEISHDASGELTGVLIDNARHLVQLPPRKPLSMDDILRTQKVVNPYGITAIRVPGAYKGDMLQAYKLWKQADAQHLLTLRYTIYLPGFELRNAQQVDALLDQWHVAQDEGDDFVRIGGVKLHVDGGFEGGHLSKPYLEPYGKGGTYSGLAVMTPAEDTEVVREINAKGWRVTTHAVGDAALEEALDAYEAADRDKSIVGHRWSVEHAFIARPDLVARLKKLNIYVSAQDHLYLAAPVLKKYWGWDVASQVDPIKTYLDAGLLVAGGTDSSTIPFNPFWELYFYATRDTISDGVYGANLRIASRPLLLRLVTINFAKLIGEEKTRGSIEPGKLADFAVLTDDFLTVPVKKMRDMKALATYVGGQEVYRDPSY